jgi:hypothetical protein
MNNPLLISSACAAICFVSAASAQDAGKVSLQFVSFPKAADAQELELLMGEGKTLSVELPTNSLSPVYRVDRLSKWVLGKTVADEEGKDTFEVYGQGSASAAAKQLVLVVRSGATNADGLTLTSFDGGTGGFGGGSYLFFNAAKVDIAATLGETKFPLKPLGHKLVHPKPSKSEGNRKYLYTYLYFRKGDEAIPFYSSTWRFSEKARSMVFLYHDKNSGQLRTHSIRDYLP